MKTVSPRHAFTGLMSCLATAFVIGIWQQRFFWQADFLADLIKVSFLIALSTAVVSFSAWSLTQGRKVSPVRGAIAGILTALIIIPLPNMGWAFKTEILSAYKSTNQGLIKSFIDAVPDAINAGLLTFDNNTKAALIAVAGSLCVGAYVAHKFAPKPDSSRGSFRGLPAYPRPDLQDENSPNPQ